VLVRTRGPYAGSRGGDPSRTWLLIKHRDEWSGELDITEFAPRSVKSGGDFEDILGGDAPPIWKSHRPAAGGDTGAMLAQIVERAARLKGARTAAEPRAARARRGKAKPAAASAKNARPATKRAKNPKKK
jgi:hypothetical protein